MKLYDNKWFKVMNSMEDVGGDFESILALWEKCFCAYLKSTIGLSKKGGKKLFRDFRMENWKALHLENTDYANETKAELIESFQCECIYISDRMSFDRLFRCHWLFNRAFEDKIFKMLYPED